MRTEPMEEQGRTEEPFRASSDCRAGRMPDDEAMMKSTMRHLSKHRDQIAPLVPFSFLYRGHYTNLVDEGFVPDMRHSTDHS